MLIVGPCVQLQIARGFELNKINIHVLACWHEHFRI